MHLCEKSSFRISGLVFGSDDYCADLGISRSLHADELLYARQKLVTTAKASRLDVIDMVFIDYKGSRLEFSTTEYPNLNSSVLSASNMQTIVHQMQACKKSIFDCDIRYFFLLNALEPLLF